MRAPLLDVLLHSGETVPFATLYADRPLGLVFVRHFGCVFCREHVASLRGETDLNLVFVGMGSPEATRDWRDGIRSPHPFICDQERELYRHFLLPEGRFGQMFNPRTFGLGFRAALKGHGVGKPVGNPWQLAGAFVIAIDGQVRWEHRSRDAADNPTAPQLRAAIEAAQSVPTS